LTLHYFSPAAFQSCQGDTIKCLPCLRLLAKTHLLLIGRRTFVVYFPKFVRQKSQKFTANGRGIQRKTSLFIGSFSFFLLFLLCRDVGYPQFYYARQYHRIRLTTLHLFDTNDLRTNLGSALRAFQSSTQGHWAGRIHRQPGNPGYLGLDQNLLGFVLCQSLVLLIVLRTDSPVSPSLG
jgi:hypothetical protein